MEEELNEHDLEERLYAMLHHVDETDGNGTSDQNNGLNILENAPRATVRRYWRTSEPTTPYQKVNTPKPPAATTRPPSIPTTQPTKPKEEKSNSPIPSPPDLSIFQSPVPQNLRKSIEIIEEDITNEVLLESSDEDEVIEVAIPPKPTITIESSDEDELVVVQLDSVSKPQSKVTPVKAPLSKERDASTSPVPSVVSSVSDEFIRGDCIALNISSRKPDQPSFDFSLHGSDLLVQSTPTKKRKKKKTKEAATSTPLVTANPDKPVANDECFATPKSKAKNKKQKTKAKSIPNADIYDSDSNSVDTNEKHNYTVSDKSLPSADVYESDSNMSETRETPKTTIQSNDVVVQDSPTAHKINEEHQTTTKNNSTQINNTFETVDLTANDSFITIDRVDDSHIQESIIMGNVSGFTENDEYEDDFTICYDNISKFGSTKIPAILNEDLDFDNLKGKDKVCRRRRYSLTTLRAEMEKFYNESWGGENFNHREIQKSMSRDKSLWVIDPKDRMPSLNRKKVTCNYCNRIGHRDDTCRMKPAVCYMCGSTGHYEPRCPRKICVNCGSPNQMYSTMCRNCSHWHSLTCAECGQRGHPDTHCPDLWRRYHNTIDYSVPLERSLQPKKYNQQYCSGCTRRGHLVHACRAALPFSGLPVHSPYVCLYRPVYRATPNKQTQNVKTLQDTTVVPNTPKNDNNKRQSKSPTVHETHVNKKRSISASEDSELVRRNTKSPMNIKNTPQRKQSLSKDSEVPNTESSNPKNQSTDGTPDFIPVHSANHDKKGNMIQDNLVSDTSDVVTSARIYVTNDILMKLRTQEGEKWLRETTEELNVSVDYAPTTSFLNIRGLVGDQEVFQEKLRDWATIPKNNRKKRKSVSGEGDVVPRTDSNISEIVAIPKNRNNLLRHLNKAFDSLKENLGDPRHLYKKIVFLQNRQEKLRNKKVVNSTVLSNNRSRLNGMLQKLNMVLLGQAGLADGRQHLNELYSLQEKLKNSRQKNITPELQKEIGQHYSSIFTPLQREDYSDLLRMYHNAKQVTLLQKKKKSLKVNPKINNLKNKKINSIPAQEISQTGDNIVMNTQIVEKKPTNNLNHQIMTRKLVYYHRRLTNTWVRGGNLKKQKGDLLRRLHTFIGSMSKKEAMSSKMLKKMHKTQEQAQMFLIDF